MQHRKGLRFQNASGLLLAGGKSRRMGSDKRFLQIGGIPLIERVLTVLTSIFEEIIISVAEPDGRLAHYGHRIVVDAVPNCAALGGLWTGLQAANRPRVFAVACDMPFLNERVIERMIMLDNAADIVIAALPEGVQPMHALYSKACLPFLEQMVRAQDLTLQHLVHEKELKARIVPFSEFQGEDPYTLSFMNINDPADLELARKLAAERCI
jgi:molybdopterin-guanine dinucleotide biosynthesis protein A